MSEAGELNKPKKKIENKKRSNWPVVVLLVMTVGLSLVFYLKNVDWGKLEIDINFDWLKDLGGSEVMTFEK